jgi:hypothetical protein
MLTRDERALLARYCNDHPVAVCRKCSEALAFDQMAVDFFAGRRDLCPRCRADLTPLVREHLAECTIMLVQIRESVDRPVQREAPSLSRNGSYRLDDESAQAVRESERVREEGQHGLGQTLLVGRVYIPIENGRGVSEHVLTTPADVGILRDDGLGQPPPPGPA